MQHIAPMISAPHKQLAVNAQKNADALERISAEKIDKIVNGSIKAISVMNNITKNDVVGILGRIHVTTIDEVQAAVENLEGIEGLDVVRLAVGIEETIKAIAGVSNLEIGEVTEILAKKNGSSIEDIVSKLYAKSRAACPADA